MAGTNNFLVFNEANNPSNTMSDADYLADLYRLNGLIPMIADPNAHNKMFRQWSIMVTALANIIASMNYNASDDNLSTLETNLKSAIEDVAEAKVDSRISTLENWKDDITATTTELNYSSGLEGNIQQQINSISGSLATPFPAWIKNTPYAVGDICICSTFDSYKYLECVVAGTTGATPPANVNIGQLVTDNDVKWLICDWKDSAPVGAFRSDIVQRLGWLKANGATLDRADYPRLWAWAVDNNLTTNDQTNNPGLFGVGDGVDTFELPDYEDYFVRYSYVRNVGSMQASQMASHTHSCGNQSASHKHQFGHNIAYVGGSAGSSGVNYGSSYGLTQYNESTKTNTQDTPHNHLIGNTGSGSNTYPDNITMQMYIKY